MKTKNIIHSLLVIVLTGTWSCATRQRPDEAAEAGETKVQLSEVPAAARQTIEHELVGAQLEDIALKTRDGKTIYETDIIRDGRKWEVVVAEDGTIFSKIKEGSADEDALEKAGSAKADK